MAKKQKEKSSSSPKGKLKKDVAKLKYRNTKLEKRIKNLEGEIKRIKKG